MAFEKITQQDLAGKGNLGRPDTPGVDTEEMQRILDELPREVIIPKFNALIDAMEEKELEEAVVSEEIRRLRVNGDGQLEVSYDGEEYQTTASSGHILLDEDGADLPQRGRLQIENAVFQTEPDRTVISLKAGIATSLDGMTRKALEGYLGGAPVPIEAEGSALALTGGENRIDSVTVQGFTAQEGSGAPSPDNLREIKNAGLCNKKITIDQSTPLSLSGEGSIVGTSRRAVYQISDIPQTASNVVGRIFSNLLPPQSSDDLFLNDVAGISVQSGGGVSQISLRVPGCMTLEDYQGWLTDHPLTVAYQSTEDTGRFYTGIDIKQGDDYHCAIVEINDRLHEGDTLETNAESGFDSVLVLTGDESNLAWSATYGNLSVTGVKTYGDTSSSVYGVCASNYFKQAHDGSISGKEPNIIYSQPGFSQIVIGASTYFDSLESAKAWLKARYAAGAPLRIFYKSAAGQKPMQRVKRTTFTKKTLVLDGTETYSSGQSGWASGAVYISNAIPSAVPAPDYSSIASIKCSHLKTVAPSAVTSGGSVGCAQGGKYNLYFFFGSEYASADAVKQYILAQYAAGTPVTIEYELAQPEVYADAPVEIENPKGGYTLSGEDQTTVAAQMKPVMDGGAAKRLEQPVAIGNAAFDGSAGITLAEMGIPAFPTGYSKSGIEMDPNFTLDSGGYFQFGKITVVNMRVTNKNEVNSNGIVCSGLPKPLREAAGANVALVVSSADHVSGVLYQSGESEAGSLKLYYMETETGSLPAGTTQRLLAVYLAE